MGAALFLTNVVKKYIISNGVPYLTFPKVLVTALIAYLICLALFFRKKSPGRNFAIALLFLYAGALFSLAVPVFPPAYWHISQSATDWAVHSINWVPFLSAPGVIQNAAFSGNWTEFFQLMGIDVVAFLPLGILVPLANPNFHLGKMLVLAVLVPVCLELLQLAGNILAGTTIRTVETEDVILGVFGCMAGYLIYAAIHRLCMPKYHARHYR